MNRSIRHRPSFRPIDYSNLIICTFFWNWFITWLTDRWNNKRIERSDSILDLEKFLENFYLIAKESRNQTVEHSCAAFVYWNGTLPPLHSKADPFPRKICHKSNYTAHQQRQHSGLSFATRNSLPLKTDGRDYIIHLRPWPKNVWS